MKLLSNFIVILIVCCSCNNYTDKKAVSHQITAKDSYAFVSHISYAGHFSIKTYNNWKQIVVFGSHKHDTLGNYALVRKNDSLPRSIPKNATIIKVPIATIAINSSTHIGELAVLNKRDAIVGLNDGTLLYDTILKKRFAEGNIKEISRQMNDNIEQILALSPQVLMKSGFDNVQSHDVRIAAAGIHVVYNVEWMENSVLGRTEWIKFVAAFFCEEALADSLFKGIETRYRDAQRLVASVQNKPHVLVGQSFNGMWYLPGDSTYLAKLLQDAGANYMTDNHTNSSLPYNFEQIFDKHSNDDFWINANAASLTALQAIDERYALFKSFRVENIYNFDKRITKTGGNDYWETAVINPDLLLKDLIKIFHPELLPKYETVYLRKL